MKLLWYLTWLLLIRDLRIPVERKRDGATGELFDQFGGMMFKDGYLYKYVSLKTIDAKGIEPSLDELQKFQKPGEDGLDALGLPPAAVRNRGQFMKGDAVVVMEGDLKTLMGIVEKVDDDDVYIIPKYKGLKVCISIYSKFLSRR
jgi:transcription elongation factor SPT5